MTTVELKITGLNKLEKILKEFKESGQIEEIIRKAIRESLTISTVKEPPWSAEFTRYAPAGMTAKDLMGVIVNYGLANDTLEEEEYSDNPVSWRIKIQIEKE